MLENVIGSDIRVQLPRPEEDGKLFWTKLGPTVYIKVDLEVIDKYTRSVKFKLKFDKYELEQIIFIPIESSPMSIKEKLHNKIEKLVCKTFLEDNRRDDMRQMYEDKRKKLFSGIENLVGKIKEIDVYGDLYERYLVECQRIVDTSNIFSEEPERFSKEEFIERLKTDEGFNKKWGNVSNKIVE